MCTLWRRFPLLTVAVWESVSAYLKKKKDMTKEEKRFTFLKVLANTRQTESQFGSFHENPEYRVFPKFRRALPYVANWRATRELLERCRDVETPFGTQAPSSPPVTWTIMTQLLIGWVSQLWCRIRICDWNDLSSDISYIIIYDTKWKQCFQQYHYQL